MCSAAMENVLEGAGMGSQEGLIWDIVLWRSGWVDKSLNVVIPHGCLLFLIPMHFASPVLQSGSL